MKKVLVIFLSLLIASCASNNVLRLVDSDSLISTDYPRLKIKINDAQLKPIENHHSEGLESYKFTNADKGVYLDPSRNGSPNIHNEYYVYAYKPSNLLSKSLTVNFYQLTGRSRWSNEINRDDKLLAGKFQDESGSYRTAIFYDNFPNYQKINSQKVYGKGMLYNITPCYLSKLYQNHLSGLPKYKFTIMYSESIECHKARNFKNEYGLTDSAKKYLLEFDSRANNSFTTIGLGAS